MEFVVRTDADIGPVFDWGAGPRRCAVGRSGIGEKHAEGDGVTPIGIWPVRYVLYRPDRVSVPLTALSTRPIAKEDGWCDAPDDRNYNRPVKLPYAARAEEMWRKDRLYDIVAVLGFNDDPVAPGKGSAIFLHISREGYAPTEGCIALALPDLLEALKVAEPGTRMRIGN